MVAKSILKRALAAEKGVSFTKLKQKRKQKAASREKRALAPQEDEWEEDVNGEGAQDDEDGQQSGANVEAVDESDESESDIEMEEKIPRPAKRQSVVGDRKVEAQMTAGLGGGDEEEDEIPISDLEDLDDEDKEDLMPHTRLTINNTSALLTSLKRINIPKDSPARFSTHMSVLSANRTAESIPDISDDLQRETALLGQSLEAARKARALLKMEGVPFSRPNDYFAEMVKPDAHMEKVKAKLIEEASAKKASAEARKLREMKKFGKQVQVAKLQDRAKAKKDTLEKIKTLKRKRQDSSGDLGTTEADLFDVAVDDEINQYKRQKTGAGRGTQEESRAPNKKRQYKNEKFGFGGKKRYSKSGDAISSGDLSALSGRRGSARTKIKAKISRPGKSRRKAQASRK